jgi:hypothetical protein
VAALIKQAVSVDPELIVGDRGEFSVWLGDDLVGQKAWSDEEIVRAVKARFDR